MVQANIVIFSTVTVEKSLLYYDLLLFASKDKPVWIYDDRVLRELAIAAERPSTC
jgi:hypothetical protein